MSRKRFSEVSRKLANKKSAYDLKITNQDVFPLKIYGSKFLVSSLSNFDIANSVKRALKKLFKDAAFRKVYLYLFWLLIGLKFRERTFGDLDHFNGKDKTIKSMKDGQRMELYRLMEQDIELGRIRRVSFIKYWRHKF